RFARAIAMKLRKQRTVFEDSKVMFSQIENLVHLIQNLLEHLYRLSA
ncbi:MAG: hypothetical protein RLZZ91_379, partial [Bacteroidota bacterium]